MKKYIREIIIGLLVIALIGVYFNQPQPQPLGAGIDLSTFTKGLDNVEIKVKIKEQTSEGQYNDSLYYSLDDWIKKSAKDITDTKQSRVDNWVNIVKTAKTAQPVEPTKEELQKQAEELQTQLNQINAQIK